MVSSEYERRIAARFATFDQDGNGYIDREDFSGAAKALLAEFAVAARSDKGQALYGGAVKRLRDNPDRFAEIARPFLHAALDLTDSDGDGAATVTDTARVLVCLGVQEDIARAAAAATSG